MEARDISRERAQPFQISLRIRHPSIDPGDVSRELKVEPEHSFKAGDPRESSSGVAATALHAESYWLGSLSAVTAASSLIGFGGARANVARERTQGAATESLTVALDAAVISFMRQHADFIRRLQSEGQVSLLIELATRSLSGFNLSPQFTRLLSDLGIAMEFDFVAN
ncbi:MAG: hypothetical protein WDO56_22970 [Gammaproteobacteria bacterium]